jgi:hypothetical protein
MLKTEENEETTCFQKSLHDFIAVIAFDVLTYEGAGYAFGYFRPDNRPQCAR